MYTYKYIYIYTHMLIRGHDGLAMAYGLCTWTAIVFSMSSACLSTIILVTGDDLRQWIYDHEYMQVCTMYPYLDEQTSCIMHHASCMGFKL